MSQDALVLSTLVDGGSRSFMGSQGCRSIHGDDVHETNGGTCRCSRTVTRRLIDGSHPDGMAEDPMRFEAGMSDTHHDTVIGDGLGGETGAQRLSLSGKRIPIIGCGASFLSQPTWSKTDAVGTTSRPVAA